LSGNGRAPWRRRMPPPPRACGPRATG
jgi:hypothetical protein